MSEKNSKPEVLETAEVTDDDLTHVSGAGEPRITQDDQGIAYTDLEK
jgi:hypothetical protein